MLVHGLDHLAQAASKRPSSKAAIAKAKATEKPTYPIYSMGGWMAKPGSCNKGFKSRPSKGAGKRRSNGLDVSNKNRIKPIETSPMTPNTRAKVASGMLLLNCATKPVHIVSTKPHNNNEPSCAPHTPEIKYRTGNEVLELVAIYLTEKSCVKQL